MVHNSTGILAPVLGFKLCINYNALTVMLPGFAFRWTSLLSVAVSLVGFDLHCTFVTPHDILKPIFTFIQVLLSPGKALFLVGIPY